MKKNDLITSQGEFFNFLDPMGENFSIVDIAHALSNLCRFGGHVKEFYSVAQHSVILSYNVDKKIQFEALMHDAAEAYIGDMVTPLKDIMEEYKNLEKKIEFILFSNFNINYPLPEEIKKSDKRMFATELRDLFSFDVSYIKEHMGIEPYNEKIIPLPPEQAKKLFLKRFSELFVSYTEPSLTK